MSSKMRLLVSVCLFVGWIGYLAYLVSITRNPVILSRPQFLVAELYVLARLDGSENAPDKTIRVLEVVWPIDEASRKLVDTEITVEELPRCGKDNGWIGPGEYIVPLSKTVSGQFSLTEIPLSPGFHHHATSHNFLRIYAATKQAREQLTHLIHEYHGGSAVNPP